MKDNNYNKITGKQLISTGVLDEFFQDIKKNSKRENWIFLRNDYSKRIAESMNYINKKNELPDPARAYLSKLEQDCNLLAKIKTHKNIFEPMHRFLRIELKVGKEYRKRFRSKEKKEFNIALFLMSMKTLLMRLGDKKRCEIMADLFLLIKNTPDKTCMKDWKKRHPNYYLKTVDNIKKRLQRLPYYFKSELQSKKFKRYERNRIISYKSSLKNNLKIGSKTKSLFKTKSGLKRHIRNLYLSGLIKKSIQQNEKFSDGLYFNELHAILKFLKIKNHSTIFKELIDDSDFLRAFAIPKSMK